MGWDPRGSCRKPPQPRAEGCPHLGGCFLASGRRHVQGLQFLAKAAPRRHFQKQLLKGPFSSVAPQPLNCQRCLKGPGPCLLGWLGFSLAVWWPLPRVPTLPQAQALAQLHVRPFEALPGPPRPLRLKADPTSPGFEHPHHRRHAESHLLSWGKQWPTLSRDRDHHGAVGGAGGRSREGGRGALWGSPAAPGTSGRFLCRPPRARQGAPTPGLTVTPAVQPSTRHSAGPPPAVGLGSPRHGHTAAKRAKDQDTPFSGTAVGAREAETQLPPSEGCAGPRSGASGSVPAPVPRPAGTSLAKPRSGSSRDQSARCQHPHSRPLSSCSFSPPPGRVHHSAR